jgi:superfamily I DNA/RNA helicase
VARLAIHRDFLRDFARLDRSVQDRIHSTFEQFEHATHSGLHLEKINNARDDRLRTIRITHYWRGIVRVPDSGDRYVLLKVLGHDEATNWIQRHKLTANTLTGAIEVRDAVAIDEATAQVIKPATVPEPLFAAVNDADMRRLGIDDQILGFARTLNDLEQLDKARTLLPEPQYEVLLGLAIGMTPDDVWAEVAGTISAPASVDPDDIDTAVERSPERVLLVTGPDELMEAFRYPFALWRVYLHPSQRQVAYASYRGSARVTGGPGTGKTVVVLHRAKHLATTSSESASVLVTTFLRTLPPSLEEALSVLIDDLSLLERIRVRHIDQLAYRVVSAKYGHLPVLKDDEEKERWRRIAKRLGLPQRFSETFLAQEWRHVVLAQNLASWKSYAAAPRTGRGRPLQRLQREQIWAAIAEFTSELTNDRVWTYETICVEATKLLAEAERKPYRHIVVDEAQDLSPWQWRLLRAAVEPRHDDIFIAGDTHQRIYEHRVSLRSVGIDVTGRSTRLTINYRTTAEILGWSLGLLRGESIDDMDGGLETLAGCRSDVHGAAPTTFAASTKTTEMRHLVTTVGRWLGQGVEPGQIGVAARSNMLVDDAVATLKKAGVDAVSLAKHSGNDTTVSVGTMHRMKGLEFRCMAVVGAGEHQVPAQSAVTPAAEDPITHAQDLLRERCLLFVACTRAREELMVSWHGNASPLIPVGDA